MVDNASSDATHNPASNEYNGPCRILCDSSTHHQHYPLILKQKLIKQTRWKRDTFAHAATKRSAPRASLNTMTGILRRISTARKALRLNSPSDRLQCPTGNTAVHRRQNQSHHGYSRLTVTIIPRRRLHLRQGAIIMFLMSMPLTKRPTYALRLRYVQFSVNQQSSARY
jgi:hypothetical protein